MYEEREHMTNNTPKESRHPFRGLRHKLEGTPSEVAQYEKEVAAHLQQDAADDLQAKATEGLSTKTPAPAKK
jgi:hypothetical protein